MRGTDVMDENVSRYRVGIRSKKWWWPIFTWLLDVSIQNAWILYRRETDNKMSQLQFRREIAQHYLVAYKNDPKCPRLNRNVSSCNETRFDRLDHMVAFIPLGKRRRCAGLNCSSITRTCCLKCDVGLCIDCFERYHTRPKV